MNTDRHDNTDAVIDSERERLHVIEPQEDGEPRVRLVLHRLGWASPATIDGPASIARKLAASLDVDFLHEFVDAEPIRDTATGGRDRAIEHERAITAQATGPTHALQKLAEERADPGPIRDFLRRDFCAEGLEEGADWRNYLVWAVLQIDAAAWRDTRALTESELTARDHLIDAIGHIGLAFQATQLAMLNLDGDRDQEAP